MNAAELTMSEALRDPMIRLMLRADRISLGDFARLLEKAAIARNRSYAIPTQTPRPELSH